MPVPAKKSALPTRSGDSKGSPTRIPVPRPAMSDESGTSQKLKRPCRLALNLFDTELMNPVTRPALLKGKVDLQAAVKVGEDPDERGLVFVCPLLLGAMTLDQIRNDCRVEGDKVVRVYLQVGDSPWKRLSDHAVLVYRDSKTEEWLLDDDVFPVEVERAEYVPPPQAPVSFFKPKR